DLGPSFVKLGQIASTRADLLPDTVIRELKRLQDDVAAVPIEEVKQTLEEDLGAEFESVFERFDEEPLASASIAQVHRAALRTTEGVEEVVVKVQRRGIRSTIERDVELLHWLARAVERSIPESRIYSPVRLVAQFDHAITAELDFRSEA